MSDTVIETNRLILRQWRTSDLTAMIAINADPKVMEFLGTRSSEQTEQFIYGNIQHFAKLGYCLYAVQLKETGELLGWVGLSLAEFTAPFTPAIEIGWRLGSQYWHRGYATEAAFAVRDYAFEVLKIWQLVSFTVPANIRSINLMQRLGFIADPSGNFEHPAIAQDHPLCAHVVYKLTSNKTILTANDPLLLTIAKPVTNFASAELKSLVAHMFEIMQQQNGVGLAAPQIGESKRLFVYGFEHNPRYPEALPVANALVINPQIIWQSDETIDLEEGCLSVPNKRLLITRSKSIKFTTYDLDGKQHEKTAHDFEARIIQHEIDHLNGVLINLRE